MDINGRRAANYDVKAPIPSSASAAPLAAAPPATAAASSSAAAAVHRRVKAHTRQAPVGKSGEVGGELLPPRGDGIRVEELAAPRVAVDRRVVERAAVHLRPEGVVDGEPREQEHAPVAWPVVEWLSLIHI